MRFACLVKRLTVKPHGDGAADLANRGFLRPHRHAAIRLVLGVVLLSPHAMADSTDAQSSLRVSFDSDVRPILQKCIGCHGPDRPKADLCLTNPDSAIELASIVPGDPDGSTLIDRVTSSDPEVRMPPDTPLSAEESNTLRRWIQQGASWPSHWAYSKLVKPRLPPRASGLRADWFQTPVDQFIAAKLTERNLAPSPPADRRTLLRRVYYDLLGLPPSRTAVIAFENDRRPGAFERVVDRLLASPQYGERWARHWMDVVHFAETHGHDQDRPREHAWPYRDYLISRFNVDVSYSRFVKEQIAGDVLFPDDPLAMIGTGFLASGPWDESSLRDIQENSVDREIGRYLDRDDIVTTVMSTFASTSAHCARCHHHKFDPISQDEYYGLQSIFAGIDKANRSYDSDPDTANKRQHLRDSLQQLTIWSKEKDDHLLSDELQGRADRWESHIASQLINWSTVEFAELSSSGGATMTLQDDNSIFVDGRKPDRDTYRVGFRSPIGKVRAVRLSVLADERLPMNGPGRQDNGNLHLNEFRIFSVSSGSEKRPQRIRRAVADFNQVDWDVTKAIDGNSASAWGIFPEVGKSHHAVFQLAEGEVSSDADTQWRIELDQVHGSGHLIGRFAIHVTRDGGPYLDELHLPEEVAPILSQTDRTREQRMVLAAYVERQRLQAELAALPTPSYVYCGTNQFEPDGSFRPAKQPRDVHVLDRGEIKKPLRPATPAVLACIDGLSLNVADSHSLVSENESARRKALAAWLADRRNGLVWRSIANRVWHYHFGRPLVDTPNDFGMAGSTPTHPELLDWLAITLQENDGSLKALHRTIVTSATYRQSSAYRDAASQIDATNQWLWRMNRKRLDAESYRDSLLQIAGTLDNRMGGPSERHFNQSKGIHVTPVVDYQNYDVNSRSSFRRSVYRFIFRTVPDPFMEALDCPDASQLSPKRGESVTAVQTLATMNDKSVIRQCELLAAAIASQHSMAERQAQVAFERILGRPPAEEELNAVTSYVKKYGLINACRLLVNTNEFMFVD